MTQVLAFIKDWGAFILLIINLVLTFKFNKKIERYKSDLQKDLTIRNLQFQKELDILSYLWESISHLENAIKYAIVTPRNQAQEFLNLMENAIFEINETISIRTPFIQRDIGNKCGDLISIAKRLSIYLYNQVRPPQAEKHIKEDQETFLAKAEEIHKAIRQRILS